MIGKRPTKGAPVAVTEVDETVRERLRPHWSLARSWLLEPAVAGDPALFDDAVAGAADVVVLDLEDGLPDAAKPAGRSAVAGWLRTGGRAWVRFSPAGTADWHSDLSALATAPGLAGVLLAKTECPEDVDATAAALPAGLPVVALVESAAGIEAAADIARVAACSRLAFGVGDFRRDTGMSAGAMALAYPRGRLVVASRAAGLPAPIDGPTLRADGGRLRRDTAVTRSMGMTGRLCLNAAHAAAINTLLSPSRAEIAEARRTIVRLDAPGPYDGSAGPTRARAQATLARAAALGVIDR